MWHLWKQNKKHYKGLENKLFCFKPNHYFSTTLFIRTLASWEQQTLNQIGLPVILLYFKGIICQNKLSLSLWPTPADVKNTLLSPGITCKPLKKRYLHPYLVTIYIQYVYPIYCDRSIQFTMTMIQFTVTMIQNWVTMFQITMAENS